MQSDSEIMQFFRRFEKARADGPFPWDRVFPGHKDIEAFGSELRTFCQGYADNVAELEYLRGLLSMSDNSERE